MDAKKILPAAIGLVLSLGVLYLTVRVVSGAWKTGQKA
jgi:hypothetical protein